MNTIKDQKQIERIAVGLNVSTDEAKAIAEVDRRIDKGEKLFDLTAEQQKVSKSMRIVPRQPTAYNFSKRERKEDRDKRFLIDKFYWKLIMDHGDINGPGINTSDVNITNPEREIEFVYKDRKYKITLSCPRS